MRVCPQCARKYVDGEAFCPFDGARLRSPLSSPSLNADPLVGTMLDGRYRIDRVLGRGGMGTVYAGLLEALEQPRAIKVLRPVLDDGQALGRFEREARTASKLGNEHIVKVFDFGVTDDGLAFIAMEMLDGQDLGDLLSTQRFLPVERAVDIIIQCCTALGAAHAAGIVHRDLKPENVFLVSRPGYREFVKIVDFGLAKYSDTEQEGDPERKLTKTGMIFGTPQYMSPEQCSGKPTDHRSDVYALGLMLYELLCGRVPFDGETFMGVINQHLVDPPRPLLELNPSIQVPPSLEAVVYRCLAKKARNRPQSMRELADELVTALRPTHSALADKLAPVASAIDEPVSAMRLTKKKPSQRPPAMTPGGGFSVGAPKLPTMPSDVDPEEATMLSPRDPALLDPSSIGGAATQEMPKPEVAPPKKAFPRTRIHESAPPGAQPPLPEVVVPRSRAPRLDVASSSGQSWSSPPAAKKGSMATYALYAVLLLALGGVLGLVVLFFAGG